MNTEGKKVIFEVNDKIGTLKTIDEMISKRYEILAKLDASKSSTAMDLLKDVEFLLKIRKEIESHSISNL